MTAVVAARLLGETAQRPGVGRRRRGLRRARRCSASSAGREGEQRSRRRVRHRAGDRSGRVLGAAGASGLAVVASRPGRSRSAWRPASRSAWSRWPPGPSPTGVRCAADRALALPARRRRRARASSSSPPRCSAARSPCRPPRWCWARPSCPAAVGHAGPRRPGPARAGLAGHRRVCPGAGGRAGAGPVRRGRAAPAARPEQRGRSPPDTLFRVTTIVDMLPRQQSLW